MKNVINLGKRTPNIAIIPAILNSFPPSRLVFLHTVSLLNVQGVLIPMNQFLSAFSVRTPAP